MFADFLDGSVVPDINDALTADRYPFVTSDGELWFTSNRGATPDLYRAPFTGTGYASPVVVTELSSATDDESYPALTRDKLQVYFTRAGATTQLRDIWTASRTTPTAEFTNMAPVSKLNSADDERSARVSPDGCPLYVGKGASSSITMYVASRPARQNTCSEVRAR